MFRTGMRVGEIGGLLWDDVDFDNEVIHIRHNLSYNYPGDGVKEVKLNTPKTLCSRRDIPFDDDGVIKNALLVQKKRIEDRKKELGSRWRSEFDDIVFATTMGSECPRYIVEKEIKKKIKELNDAELHLAVAERREPRKVLPDFHPHSIRHTFATRCAEKGVDMKVTQKILGHSNINITRTIYEHVSPQRAKDELRKLSSTFGNVSPITSKSHT